MTLRPILCIASAYDLKASRWPNENAPNLVGSDEIPGKAEKTLVHSRDVVLYTEERKRSDNGERSVMGGEKCGICHWLRSIVVAIGRELKGLAR